MDYITPKPSTKPSPSQQAQIDRKYGMFIHFGINTFNDTEWSDGKLSVSSYNPPEIDADGWVRNAYESGMNYVILITKHHDGFCLFDTKYTDYGVNHSQNKMDVVLEVSKACKKYGVKLGLYYSLWDRHEKCYEDDEKYVEYMCGQLTELLGGKYGEVCEVWFDGGWDKTPDRWNIPKLYDLVHRLQPNSVSAVNVTIGYKWSKKSLRKFLPSKYKERVCLLGIFLVILGYGTLTLQERTIQNFIATTVNFTICRLRQPFVFVICATGFGIQNTRKIYW